VPESWTPDQIKNFQDYWDAYFTGDLAARRRAKFVPGGVAKTFIQTKEPELKNLFDEWLARIVCYAFSVSPQAFVAHVNRATGETQKEMAEEEGLWPVLMWVKRLIDRVLIEDFGESEIEFAWGSDAQIDAEQQQRILVAYVGSGILTRDEARQKLGLAPLGRGAAGDTARADAGEIGKAYNPEQPRDECGRWTCDASGLAGASGGVLVAHDTTRANDAAFSGAGPALDPRVIRDAARAEATVAFPGLLGAEVARRSLQWWTKPTPPSSSENSQSKPDNAPPPAHHAKPENSAPVAAAPAAPEPEDREPEKSENQSSESNRKFTVPDREPSIDNPEDYKLGWDSDKKEFLSGEVKTAWRLQELLQQPLKRSTIGGDFIAPEGKVYDAMGPVPDKYFNMKEFANSINDHLLKSEMTTVIDLTGMRPNNIKMVDDYLSTLPPEARAKIIRIGH
jgi:hypothetical protein